MRLQDFEGLYLVLGPDLFDLVVDILINPLLDTVIVERVLARRDGDRLVVLEVVGAD